MRTRLPKEILDDIAARRRSADAVALLNEIRRLQIVEQRAIQLLQHLDTIPTVRHHQTVQLILIALRDALGEPQSPEA